MSSKKLSSFDYHCIKLMIIIVIFLEIIQCLPQQQQQESKITTTTTTQTTTTTIKTLSCKASMIPRMLTIKPSSLSSLSLSSLYGRFSIHETITIHCMANLTADLDDNFINPVFDLSFGDQTNSGLYIVRGRPNCQQNHTNCESEFQISILSLIKLLLPKMNNDNYRQSSTSILETIKVTCDIADTSRHLRMPVRCNDSVLNYGDSCRIGSEEECPTNMQCSKSNDDRQQQRRGRRQRQISTTTTTKCQCKHGYLNVTTWIADLNSIRTICIQPIAIGDSKQCLIDEQCLALDKNSDCRYDNKHGYPICQCRKDYHLHQNGSCQSIHQQINESKIYNQTILPLHLNHHHHNHPKNESLINDDNSGKTMKPSKESSSLSKTISNLGLVIFLIVLLWAIIIASILIRYAKQKQRLDINYQKKQSNNDEEDDDNDNDSRIDGKIKKQNGINNQIILKSHHHDNRHLNNSNNDNDFVEMRIDDQQDGIISTTTTTFPSQQQQQPTRNRNEPPNFDIFAKQSVV
ncbi:hypothetical protein DERP_012368 [Dermatophagoides pteronyssinus]|uniref:Uncharacterized protein n=1 Tax=Dermatophagoides pteronyssinus TaxID=6956 RepID=A0ABQ8IUJ4_DERPT|nr:hypothetical protein DERP_012368 [Dermatophagoides pteronyssinus]